MRTATLFARQVEYFLHLLPVVDEIPLLGVVVGAEHCDHQVIHVTGLRAIEIRGVEKLKVMVLPSGEALACIRGWLPTAAVMSQGAGDWDRRS